jgi:hypothetical protein
MERLMAAARTLTTIITASFCAAGVAQVLAPVPQPVSLRSAPAETQAAAYQNPEWDVPRTSWGHPSFEGVWSTDDMRSVPLNRPEQFGARQSLSNEEFRERAARDEAGSSGEGSFLQHEWGIRTFGYTSMVVDPPNGRMPGLTPAGQALAATRNNGTFGPGPFNAFEDFTLYDRCITRGVLGSTLPVIYGNGIRIAQSPDAFAISYEMIHDTRIVPLDGRPHVSGDVKSWMGNARGWFEGDTLVVETRNFMNRTNLGTNGNGPPNSEAMTLTERFTRVDPQMIEYIATVEDPVAYEVPFTVRLMITTHEDYQLLEYSCHEGNGAVPYALSGERVYEQQVADALARGLPPPARAVNHNQIRDGIPDPDQVIDVNRGEAR